MYICLLFKHLRLKVALVVLAPCVKFMVWLQLYKTKRGKFSSKSRYIKATRIEITFFSGDVQLNRYWMSLTFWWWGLYRDYWLPVTNEWPEFIDTWSDTDKYFHQFTKITLLLIRST